VVVVKEGGNPHSLEKEARTRGRQMIGENLIDGTNRHEPKHVVTKALGFWVVIKMKGKREEITYFERPRDDR